MAQCTRLSLHCKKLLFHPISPTATYRCFRICTVHQSLPSKQRYSATKHNRPNNHYNHSPSVCSFSTSNNDSSRGGKTSDISQDATSKSASVIREGFHQLWKNLVYRISKITGRSNPILDDITEITMGIKNRPIFYSRLHNIQPHHFSDAFEVILSQAQTLHQEMEDTFRGILIIGSTGDEKQLLIDNIHIHGLPLEDSVLQNLYRIYFPTYYLRNLLGLYMQVNQITILRRDRTVFQNLLLIQSKLAYYNATLTPTNTSLLYLTMEHIKEKQSQLLTRESSLQRQKEYDELEKKRRAFELILERESTVCCTDDNTEQQLGISQQSRQLQEKKEDEIDELHIFQTLKKISFQIKRGQQQQGRQQQEQQKYYASALTHIYQILSSRKRKANMLGYESYAQLFLSKNMMIKNCEDITAIHSSIAERAIPVVLKSQERRMHEKEEGGRVTNVAGGGSFSTSTLQKPAVWDKLSAYLELQTVLKGMFDLTRRLFGIVIKEDTTDKSHQTWDRDVRIFHLYDEDDEMKYLASFYLDLYQRPDSKVLGDNMCISLVDRAIQSHTKTSIVATDPSSSNTASSPTTTSIRTSPLVCIICDIHPADWNDSPCLLSFEDAINLFHEFGHALHQMLTAVDVGFVAGTNGVELDAVEFPSQFLPLWLYDKDTLISIGKHYQTGKKIPDQLYNELTNERLLRSPLRVLNQVFQGQLELELYDAKNDNQSVLQIIEDCSNRFALPKPQNTKDRKDVDLSQVLDLFVDGTPEFRYRYIISEIMSCDAFAAFQEAGLSNDDSVAILGRKFRDTILATGGGLEASDAYRRFRGRNFQIAAFLKHNGLP